MKMDNAVLGAIKFLLGQHVNFNAGVPHVNAQRHLDAIEAAEKEHLPPPPGSSEHEQGMAAGTAPLSEQGSAPGSGGLPSRIADLIKKKAEELK